MKNWKRCYNKKRMKTVNSNVWIETFVDFMFLLEISFDMIFALAFCCFLLQCLQKLFFRIFFKKPPSPAIKSSFLLLLSSIACLFLFPAGLVKTFISALFLKVPSYERFPFHFLYPIIVLIWFFVTCFLLLRQVISWFSFVNCKSKLDTHGRLGAGS